ncbi:hypothetical protein Agub_g14373 [Astrephomene gubernaculifera]|uniref:Bromo domain-containing protein n=1 Tax=Astrephomene gubernaculifera TaxID=47775 RepID=A0AAD3E3W5_9CHLO|nr:hypothetical protein Agub_g14373 [Astrephomene gubernaculifera]
MELDPSTQATPYLEGGARLSSLLVEIILHILEHTPHASFFRSSVSCALVTDYRDFVPEAQEMHLGNILERAQSQLYVSIAAFREDLQRIRHNAIAYNGPNGGKHGYEPVIYWANDLIAAAEQQLQLRMPALISAEEQQQVDLQHSDATVTVAISPTAAWLANTAAAPRHGTSNGAKTAASGHPHDGNLAKPLPAAVPSSPCGDNQQQTFIQPHHLQPPQHLQPHQSANGGAAVADPAAAAPACGLLSSSQLQQPCSQATQEEEGSRCQQGGQQQQQLLASPSRSSGSGGAGGAAAFRSGSGGGGGGSRTTTLHSGLDALLAACELVAEQESAAAAAAAESAAAAAAAADGGDAMQGAAVAAACCTEYGEYGRGCAAGAGASGVLGPAPLSPQRTSYPGGCTSSSPLALQRSHSQQQQQLQLALVPLRGLAGSQQQQQPQLLLQPLQHPPPMPLSQHNLHPHPHQPQQQQHGSVGGGCSLDETAASSEDGCMAVCSGRSNGGDVGGPTGRSGGGASQQTCSSYLASNAFKNRRHKSKVYIKPNKVVYLPTTFVEEEFEVACLPLDCCLLVEADGADTEEVFRVTIKAVPRAGLSTMYCMTNVMRFQQRYLHWQIANWTRLEDGNIRIHLHSPAAAAAGAVAGQGGGSSGQQQHRQDMSREASLTEVQVGSRGAAPCTSDDSYQPGGRGEHSGLQPGAGAGRYGGGGGSGGGGSGGGSLKRRSDTGAVGRAGGGYPGGGGAERRLGPELGGREVFPPELRMSSTGYPLHLQHLAHHHRHHHLHLPPHHQQQYPPSSPSAAAAAAPESPPVSPQRRTSHSAPPCHPGPPLPPPPRAPPHLQQYPPGCQPLLLPPGLGMLPGLMLGPTAEAAPHMQQLLSAVLQQQQHPGLVLPAGLFPMQLLPSAAALAAAPGMADGLKQELGGGSGGDGGGGGGALGMGMGMLPFSSLLAPPPASLLGNGGAAACAGPVAGAASDSLALGLQHQQQLMSSLPPLPLTSLPMSHVQSLEQQLQQLHDLSQQLQQASGAAGGGDGGQGSQQQAAEAGGGGGGELQGLATLQLAAMHQLQQQQAAQQQQQEAREAQQRVEDQQQQQHPQRKRKHQLQLQPLQSHHQRPPLPPPPPSQQQQQQQQQQEQQQQYLLPAIHPNGDQANGPNNANNASNGNHDGSTSFPLNSLPGMPAPRGTGTGTTAAGLFLQPLRLQPLSAPSSADAPPSLCLPHSSSLPAVLQTSEEGGLQPQHLNPQLELLRASSCYARLCEEGGGGGGGSSGAAGGGDGGSGGVRGRMGPSQLQHGGMMADPMRMSDFGPLVFDIGSGGGSGHAAGKGGGGGGSRRAAGNASNTSAAAAAAAAAATSELGLRACTAEELKSLLSPSKRCKVAGGCGNGSSSCNAQQLQVATLAAAAVHSEGGVSSSGGGALPCAAAAAAAAGGGCMPDMPAERIGPMGLRLSPLMPEAAGAALLALCAGAGLQAPGAFAFPTSLQPLAAAAAADPSSVGARPFLQQPTVFPELLGRLV